MRAGREQSGAYRIGTSTTNGQRTLTITCRPLEGCTLGTVEWSVPPEALREGTNRLRIANLEEDGPVGGRPWFGVEWARLAPK